MSYVHTHIALDDDAPTWYAAVPQITITEAAALSSAVVFAVRCAVHLFKRKDARLRHR